MAFDVAFVVASDAFAASAYYYFLVQIFLSNFENESNNFNLVLVAYNHKVEVG
jgi:hypothetical protein